MNILSIVSKIFDYNPISYRLLRNLKERPSLTNLLGAVISLPVIPIWNFMAEREIADIHKNNSVYKIKRGEKETIFYLPDLNLSSGEFIQSRIFLERNYFEWRRLIQIRTYVKEKGIVLDIGANIGNHSLYFAQECHVRKVYAFEPVKSTFEILVKNISLNKFEKIIVPYLAALGDYQGKGNIIYMGDAGGNKVEPDDTGEVVISTVDGLEIKEQIDFIKIDVEGYEEKVLKGAEITLKKYHPVIMIEIFDENFNCVNSYLRRQGYGCELKIENDYLYSWKSG